MADDGYLNEHRREVWAAMRAAIARATGSETNDSGPPDEKLSRWKAAAAMDPGPCVEVGSKTREG
jgi:hypothetical protein